jgi:hypothetical protein
VSKVLLQSGQNTESVAAFTMLLTILAAIGAANAVVLPRQTGLKVVLGNDDGWATSNIRAFYNSLNQAGYNVSLSI